MIEANEIRPMGCVPTERGTAVLTAHDGKQVEYFLRGALCWPVIVPGHERVEGSILLGGAKMDGDKRLVVFEQFRFTEVQQRVDTEGVIVARGCHEAFNIIWATYQCRRFFFNHFEEFHDTNLLLVSRNAAIRPKPDCVQTHWRDDDEAWARILLWAPRTNFLHGGPLEQQMSQYRASPGAHLKEYPALWALACLIAGLERWPARPR